MRIRARHERRQTAGLALALSSLLAFGVGTVPLSLSAQTIRGLLVDADSGAPIELGTLTLLTLDGLATDTAISDAEGAFSLEASSPGSFLLRASAWGYGDRVDGVFELGDGGRVDVEVRMAPEAMTLEEVLVPIDRPAEDHRLVRNGFVDRYRRGFGRFVTPDDLRRTVYLDTESLFRFMPGVRVLSSRNLFGSDEAVVVRSMMGWCRPSVYVDGVRTRYDPGIGQTLSSLVPVGWIEAVEVYVSPAEIPLEYGITTSGGCGVILFWLKR